MKGRGTRVALKQLLAAVAVGARDEELFTSLASRLAWLDKQLTEKEKAGFARITGGKTIPEVAGSLLNAYNPDILEDLREKMVKEKKNTSPAAIDAQIKAFQEELQNKAAFVFTGQLNEYIENIRKAHEQKIDLINPDQLLYSGWDKDQKSRALDTTTSFTAWIESHKDEITALVSLIRHVCGIDMQDILDDLNGALGA